MKEASSFNKRAAVIFIIVLLSGVFVAKKLIFDGYYNIPLVIKIISSDNPHEIPLSVRLRYELLKKEKGGARTEAHLNFCEKEDSQIYKVTVSYGRSGATYLFSGNGSAIKKERSDDVIQPGEISAIKTILTGYTCKDLTY